MILGLTLPRTEPPALYTYPARPLNGGPFEKARLRTQAGRENPAEVLRDGFECLRDCFERI